ncbi:PAS domain-containing sensor histidine kinase [Halarchaeum sp. CBA1220]|uniref:PAS domain-containing sensor histidine kinase n=1 Tax=Halarchaeum sp. CBA1220 TaxID=1853682 RepID=UPI0015A33625|nr:PAS domain-containing sensor histidine kinase [Halarchaeum sp. CBA1220]QLC34369.1 PAS domain-containing sensor histidine kinase [Halarchaeum sp. CBA1220]
MEADPAGILLDHAQDKILLLEEDGVVTYVNAAVRPMLGFDPDDLLGDCIFDYVHPDDAERVRETFGATIAEDDFVEVTVEYRHRTSDGDWRWLESRMSNLTDATLDGYVVSSRDVTDRVTAEHDRDTAASRLHELSTTTGDVLWMFDADWSELLFVNPAYEELYGASIDGLRDDPRSFLERVHPDDRPAVEAAMARLSDGESLDMEYRIVRDGRRDRWVWVQGQPIVEDGDVVRIAGFTKDVSDRRRRERQLVVVDNLLRHNLRNDLNVIIGTADSIASEFPALADRTAVIRRTSRDLLASAEKQRELIDLVCEQPGRTPVDLASLLEDAVATVRERYPNATVDYSGGVPARIRGRPELEAAVVELLENAITHSRSDAPRVRVRQRETNTHVEITVADDAPPLPPVEADVLTGDHEMTDVYHSTGIGLWLVYWSVDLSNGHITVRSTESGNRITLSLPHTTD